jgi:hypothetical protein
MCQTCSDKWTEEHAMTLTMKYIPDCQKQDFISCQSYRSCATLKVHGHVNTSYPELLVVGGWNADDNLHKYNVCFVAIRPKPPAFLQNIQMSVKRAHVLP